MPWAQSPQPQNRAPGRQQVELGEGSSLRSAGASISGPPGNKSDMECFLTQELKMQMPKGYTSNRTEDMGRGKALGGGGTAMN